MQVHDDRAPGVAHIPEVLFAPAVVGARDYHPGDVRARRADPLPPPLYDIGVGPPDLADMAERYLEAAPERPEDVEPPDGDDEIATAVINADLDHRRGPRSSPVVDLSLSGPIECQDVVPLPVGPLHPRRAHRHT